MASLEGTETIEELNNVYTTSMDTVVELTRQIASMENKQRAAKAAYMKAAKKREIIAQDLLSQRRTAEASGTAAQEKILAWESVSEATSAQRRVEMEIFTRCKDPLKTWKDGRVHCACECQAMH